MGRLQIFLHLQNKKAITLSGAGFPVIQFIIKSPSSLSTILCNQVDLVSEDQALRIDTIEQLNNLPWLLAGKDYLDMEELSRVDIAASHSEQFVMSVVYLANIS